MIRATKKINFCFYLCILIFIAAIQSCMVSNSATTNYCTEVDMTSAMGDKEKNMIKAMGKGWFEQAKVCELGGYFVAVPVDNLDGSLYIWKDKYKVLEINRRDEVNIFQQVSGQLNYTPVVSLQDRDENGVYDRIYYKFRWKNGNVFGDLADFNLDGIPDMRILYLGKEKTRTEIWIEDTWYLKVEKDGKSGVYIEDQWREVKINNGLWEFIK